MTKVDENGARGRRMGRLFNRRSLFAIAVSAGFLLAAPAQAASDPLAFAGKLFDRAWSYVSAPFSGDASAAIAPPSSPIRERDLRHSGRSGFWEFLYDAGYKFKEAITEVGLIPGIDIEFVIARELSEADRDAIERELEIDAKRNSGLIPAIQRKIVRTLLEASEIEGMRIEKLTIGILPLPSAEFVLAPSEGPMGEEHDTIYRTLLDMRKLTRDKALN